MKKLILLTILACLAALFAPTGIALAGDCDTNRQIFGDAFTLGSGGKLESNLVVFGGTVAIEDGATAECELVIYGGNVEIAGKVEDNITIFGGNLVLRDTAVVEGTLTTVGGSFTREDGAEVEGGVSQGFSFGRPSFGFLPEPYRALSPVVDFFWAVIWAGLLSVLAAALALVVMVFLPDQTTRVSAALTAAPLASGLLGFLSLFAVPVVLALVALTICLSPLTLVGGVIYGAAIIFGWLALGVTLGTQISRALKLYALSPVVWAMGGAFVLTLFVNLTGVAARFGDVIARYGGGLVAFMLSCLNVLLPLTLVSLGLGAVILTRFGTRPYLTQPAAPPTQPTPPAPASDIAADAGEAPAAS